MNGLTMPQQAVPLVWTPYGWMPLEVPEFAPGTDIFVSVPVTNNSNQDAECKIQGNLHQGAQTGTGDLLAEWESDVVPVMAGRTASIYLPGGDNFPHTTLELGAGTFGVGIERDLTVTLYYKKDGEWIEYDSRDFRPIYKVPEIEYEFTIGQPSVNLS